MKTLLLGAIGTIGALALTVSAAPAAGSSSGTTLADYVALSGDGFDQRRFDFDILLEAATTANLVGALADESADLTLFAPNDRAFFRLAVDLGYTGGYDEGAVWSYLVDQLTALGGGDPIPVLTDILLYHVAPESLNAFQVLFSREIDTLLTGATFGQRFLRLIDNDPDIADPRVFIPLNLRATNGIFHTINRVLIPVDL